MQAFQERLDHEQTVADGVPGLLDIRELSLYRVPAPHSKGSFIVH